MPLMLSDSARVLHGLLLGLSAGVVCPVSQLIVRALRLAGAHILVSGRRASMLA